jgi:hypothetical protein
LASGSTTVSVQPFELLAGRAPAPGQIAQHPFPHHLGLGDQGPALLAGLGPDGLGLHLGLEALLLAVLAQRVALGLGLAPHLGDDLGALGPATIELARGVGAQLLDLGQQLGPLGGDGGLGLGAHPVRLVVGLADQPRRRFLGLAPDVGRRRPGRVEHPRRLLAQDLDQPVLVELLGLVGAGLGPLGPGAHVGLAAPEAAHHGGQLVQVGPDLVRVVAPPRRRELPLDDATGVEVRIGRHRRRG